MPARGRPQEGKRGRLARFVATYGWRAYALPVLTVVTVLVIIDTVHSTGHPQTTSDPARERVTDSPDPALGAQVPGHVIGAPRGDGRDAPSGGLPDGGPFSTKGAGRWHVVSGSGDKVGQGVESVITYTVEVEDGVETTSYGGDQAFATMVDKTLANPKSWTTDPRFAFRRIDKGKPSLRISLTSQLSTRRACGFDIAIDTSCFNQDLHRVVLDEARWVRGAPAFQGDIGSYRQYMVNHEVGHAIGYHRHQPCETNGGLAPIMMQQTFGTANNDVARLDPAGVVPTDGKVCHYNPWPYPRSKP